MNLLVSQLSTNINLVLIANIGISMCNHCNKYFNSLVNNLESYWAQALLKTCIDKIRLTKTIAANEENTVLGIIPSFGGKLLTFNNILTVANFVNRGFKVINFNQILSIFLYQL